MKSHFAVNDKSECGRGKVITDKVRRVTCLVCQSREAFVLAKAADDADRLQAFYDQTPRTFAEPWNGKGNIVCNCGSDLFRQADRTCYGHYDNYVCASCGETTQRLTETGMSF